MKKLGNITILTKEEIIKRGKDKDQALKDNPCTQDIYCPEYYERLIKEPLPYKLFRLNELFSYSLDGVGCEITESQYMDRLEQLPPKAFKNDIFEGYIVTEPITHKAEGVVYEHIFQHDNKYYCVIMRTNFKVV